jgi:hypothetical protein
MLEQLAFRTPLTIHGTNEQDLNPRSWEANAHASVMAHEMMVIESGEKPTRMLTWKPTVFLSHIVRRSHDDRFSIPLWETWCCSSLGVQIPADNLISTPVLWWPHTNVSAPICSPNDIRMDRLQDHLDATQSWSVYYESIKRELKIRPTYDCRCDERLKTKAEDSTRLTYTGLRG